MVDFKALSAEYREARRLGRSLTDSEKGQLRTKLRRDKAVTPSAFEDPSIFTDTPSMHADTPIEKTPLILNKAERRRAQQEQREAAPAPPPAEPSVEEMLGASPAADDLGLFSFVTGPAGSGKTYMMRELCQQHGPAWALCASTGIAAVNLGDAVTINSYLGYFDTASLEESFTDGFLQARLRKYRAGGLRRIVLDEISMVEAPQLTVFVRALEEVNADAWSADDPSLQIGLTLVGDFCLGVGTRVTMADGTLLPVEQIRVGMQVMGPDSCPRNVLRTTRGSDHLYRIDQTNGASYVVNGRHSLALRRSRDGQRWEGTARRYPQLPDDITMEAALFAQQSEKFRTCFVGYKAGVLAFPETPVRLDPYFLGVWLGDGDKDGPRITTADPEIFEYCRWYAKTWGLGVSVHRWARTQAVRVRLTNGRRGKRANPIHSALRAYGLLHNKHLPTAYLYNDASIRLQLLAGLLDADGCWSGNRYTVTFASERLAGETKQLADQLGFRTGWRVAPAAIGTGTSYTVSIGGDTWRIPCRVLRKKSLPRALGRSRLTSVLRAVPLGVGEYAGFEIDGDHLFVLADGTVTHNCQLPPVKGAFAFESPEWWRFAERVTRLTEIRRQGDPAFIEALRAIRSGEPDAAVDLLGPQMHETTIAGFDGPTVLAKNDQVDRFNALRHDQLTGTLCTFQSKRWGKERGEWKNIPDTLRLKEGALVMILANRREEGQGPLVYANGDLGHLRYVSGEGELPHAMVELQRTGETVPVIPITRKHEKPTGAKGTRKEAYETIGEITYMPLRLAYATSVHKSQGLTFDTVQVNIRDRFFASPAMCYVALSRARSLEGLRLVGTPDMLKQRATIHPKVRAWI